MEMSVSKTVKLVDIVAIAFVAWGALFAIPGELIWFDPQEVIISDSRIENPPTVSFKRDIKRDVKMKYQVVIRELRSKVPVCDPTRGPFTYRTDSELPTPINLIWWTGADERCWPREEGTYIAETCWTIVEPFWGLVPPKSVCRDSNPFSISK